MTPTPVAPLVGSPPEQTEPPQGTPRPQGLVARLLVTTFRAYQLARIGRVSPCRFTPTCSHYAVEAVSCHGARHGLALTVRRLARCRGPYGFDPVPEHPQSRMGDQ
jgi:putative membrane protein insertion efficiency factor